MSKTKSKTKFCRSLDKASKADDRMDIKIGILDEVKLQFGLQRMFGDK